MILGTFPRNKVLAKFSGNVYLGTLFTYFFYRSDNTEYGANLYLL